jgi:hypothetical protein
MITPDGGKIGSSVNVSLDSVPFPYATAFLELRVLRVAIPPGTDLTTFDPASEATQVVYKATTPMAVRAITVTNQGQWGYLASWGGALSVNDWSGACQSNSLYTIKAVVLDAGRPGGETDKSRWFTCNASP